MRLRFSAEGALLSSPSRLLEIQLPAILDLPGWPVESKHLAAARAKAAEELKSLAMMPADEASELPSDLLACVVPILNENDIDARRDLVAAVRMAQVADGPRTAELAGRLQAINPQLVVSVRMVLSPSTADRVMELSGQGIKVFHLCADQHGRERLEDGRTGRHIKDALRDVHGRLVKEGLRDEVTLIVSGGIALAEHMAKAIICGADLVAVDTPPLVALGCHVCGGGQACDAGRNCPIDIGTVDADYAARRIVNLMGAWHSQLIEVLGAMGIREVRRLRGEVGRGIFMEDIEKEAFGDLARVPRAGVQA
jgi:hypothetical protein